MKKYNENNTNNILLFVATVIIGLMIGMLYLMNGKLNQYKGLLEKTDTITYADTIYLDKVVRDTVPETITQTIFKCDTLWKIQGDSVVGEPQLITLVKKKSAIH